MTTEGATTRDLARIEQEHGMEKTRALLKYRGSLHLSKAQALDILNILWPKAPEGDKLAAAALCVSYRLNPLAGHVFLVPFETKEGVTWARIMGIKAKRLIAHRGGSYSYEDYSPRIMSKEEQEKVFGKVDNDNLCFITILRDIKTGAIANGFGKWPKTKGVYGADKGNTPENMASIRSESQALDRLRPGEMPELEVVDEAYETLSPTAQEVEEDINRLWGPEEKGGEKQVPPPTNPPAVSKPQEKSDEKPGGQGQPPSLLTPRQKEAVLAIARQHGWSLEVLNQELKQLNYPVLEKLTIAQASGFITWAGKEQTKGGLI